MFYLEKLQELQNYQSTGLFQRDSIRFGNEANASRRNLIDTRNDTITMFSIHLSEPDLTKVWNMDSRININEIPYNVIIVYSPWVYKGKRYDQIIITDALYSFIERNWKHVESVRRRASINMHDHIDSGNRYNLIMPCYKKYSHVIVMNYKLYNAFKALRNNKL